MLFARHAHPFRAAAGGEDLHLAGAGEAQGGDLADIQLVVDDQDLHPASINADERFVTTCKNRRTMSFGERNGLISLK